MAVVDALCNLGMIVAISVPMIRGNREGRTLKMALIVLNISVFALHSIEATSLYGIGNSVPYVANSSVPPLTSFTLLGVMMLQLELRITFNALIASRLVDTGFWTSSQKIHARIVVVVSHFIMCWPAYLNLVDEAPLIANVSAHFMYLPCKSHYGGDPILTMYVYAWKWHVLGVSLQALIITIVSFMQAVLITSRLIKHSTSESGYHPRQWQCFVLIALIIVTFFMNIAGIMAFSAKIFLGKVDRPEIVYMCLLLEQFAIVTLGFEVLCETASLLLMVHWVKSKHVPVPSSGIDMTFTTEPKTFKSALQSHNMLPQFFHSGMFKTKSVDYRSQTFNSSIISSAPYNDDAESAI
ncbi:hypothetical protein BASA61_002784 [Batrachochytrium salamandrivorans]|nr:hypothetical protein BASA61_002784 [Batrachochytrium salamandrivorans]